MNADCNMPDDSFYHVQQFVKTRFQTKYRSKMF